MTVIIMLAVFLGIAFGYLLFPVDMLSYTDYIMDVGLCLLLLLVGIDIGRQKNVLQDIKKMGFSIILLPLLIALGSIVGAIVGGTIIGMPLNESSAIGGGLGWYSISAVLLSDYSTEISAIAFLSNVMREIIAILAIPLIAKYIGYMESVAPPGATAMDTTLPIITKYTDSKTAVVAFISGVVLSLLVPILVPLLIGLV
ncbi:lysine exporter LysO family protein [Vallitalea pronyensis]|uniref:Lysine exporter LysO family protein n=1 Tax=Vallitalea pronyensis TaxID=1348613 RepID=A0A8J8MI43_9FIRM|nr:lysine exporter LysO family protein [Vallitalea pronyensis]QUI22044.1 lysine exporter LysO family protein [Vallitalea pronyensis]